MAEEDKDADKTPAAGDKAAAAAPATGDTAESKGVAEPTSAAPPKEQTVPLSRLQAVIAQKAEAERAREQLTRELKLAQDTLDEFKALGNKGADADATTTSAKPAATAKPLTPEELQRLVTEEGARQAFNQRCNEAVAAGRSVHQDFDKVVLGDLTSISPMLDRATGRPTLPVPLIEAALETGKAAEVLYALGQNASEASRIMSLRPIQQAVELAKFAAKMEELTVTEEDTNAAEELKNVSKAPAPIKPAVVKGSTTPKWTEYDTEHFDTKEWIRQRERQLKDARAAR